MSSSVRGMAFPWMGGASSLTSGNSSVRSMAFFWMGGAAQVGNPPPPPGTHRQNYPFIQNTGTMMNRGSAL